MKKVEDFAGYISSLERNDGSLLMRLMPWGVVDDPTPVLVIKCEQSRVSCSDGITLESVRDNEYEIDEIEYDKNRLSIWVYDFELPLVIDSSEIQIEYCSYDQKEFQLILLSKDKLIEQSYEESKELRAKVNQIESFIVQQENRVLAKSANHPEGSEGHRLYKEQLKLISKLKSRLKT